LSASQPRRSLAGAAATPHSCDPKAANGSAEAAEDDQHAHRASLSHPDN